MLDTHGRKYIQPLFDKASEIAIKLKLSPIKITILAFLAGLISIIFIMFEKRYSAVLFLWISGILDVLDGTVARKTNTISPLGAFLDITFDRVIEIGLILGLALTDGSLTFMTLILTSTIVLSMTVFLTFGNLARNNGIKSFRYQAGLAERTEGFIFFTLIIIFETYRIQIGYFFALLILITALQRFYEGINVLKNTKL